MSNKRGKSASVVKLEAEVAAVLSTPDGRDFMWRLLTAAGVYQANPPRGGDAHSMAYREGERAMGLLLTSWLLTQPALYQRMWAEKSAAIAADTYGDEA
jgi:hypothetical protein